MHLLQHPIAPALQRDVGALAQFRQPPIRLDEIIAVTFGMGRREANAFEAFNGVHCFEQLHESRFAIANSNLPFPVTGDDLPKQCDFADALAHQLPALGHNIGNGATALFTARGGNDAEGAMLIAALHDADIGSDRFFSGVPRQHMFTNGRFTPRLRLDIDNFFTAP